MDNNPPAANNGNLDLSSVDKVQAEIIDGTSSKANYRPTKQRAKIRRTVYQRYYWLRDEPLRAEAEDDWQTADQEYMLYTPQPDQDDWRAHLQLPDSFSAIQAQAQESIERKTRPYLCPTEESDEPIAEFANSILEYNMNTTGFDYQYFLAKIAASIRGTAFLMEYWRHDKRVVKDPKSIDKNGNITYQEREITDFDDSYSEWVPNEFIYIDEKAKHIDEGGDMIRRQIMNIDDFHRVYGGKPGFYDTDYVVAGGDTSNKSFFELPRDVNSQDVEVLHYYNRNIDAYWVVANNIAIFDGPLQTKHKELPVSVVYQYRVPGRFWGMGIPKVVHNLSEERKSIRNLNLDRQKLQIGGAFLHNSSFDIDDEDSQLAPGRFISVDTNGQRLTDAIQRLEFGDVPASYFRTEEILLEDIKRAHGIDDRVQGVNVGGTATEAALLKESALKRINMLNIANEMDTILRIGKLKWANIQFFYATPRIERITEKNDEREEKVYKQVTVQGKKFSIVKDEEGNNQLKMDEVKGASALQINKEFARYIDGSYDITVESDVYTPPSKALFQTQVTQAMSQILGNPVTSSVIDPTKAVTMILKTVYQKPDALLPEDAPSEEDMQMLAEAENLVMSAGQPLSPTENATQAHTLVHLQYTKSVDFQSLPPPIQQIFEMHILGEHDANPATDSAGAALSGAPEPPAPPPGPGGQPGGNQNLQGQPGPQLSAPGGAGPQPQVADMQGANFGG